MHERPAFYGHDMAETISKQNFINNIKDLNMVRNS